MGLVVQKFGGTSVGSVDRIRKVAKRIAATRRKGQNVVAVVSAMSGETNRLLDLGRSFGDQVSGRELDVLLATGEQVSAALVAIALQQEGIGARSLLGHQLRLRTDASYQKARIQRVDRERLLAPIDEGDVVVVAGFQGVDANDNITTLGRGGSDTSAVALAAALNAELCEIYTDVDGVYTTDPRICPSARKIDTISYEEMLELASLGAKVLQIRSVEMAMKYGVPLHVRSTFSEESGTMVVDENADLESIVVTGVTSDRNAAKITVRDLSDKPGIAATLFEALAEDNISVDMIIQNVSIAGSTDLTFTLTRSDVDEAMIILEEIFGGEDPHEILLDTEVVKVSIVGLGMRSHAGVAANMFRQLANEGINIEAISTSEIKVSCLIAAADAEQAVRTLHEGFALGG